MSTLSLAVKQRQAIERMVINAAIDQLLRAGFTLGVNDGEDTTVKWCADKAVLMAAIMTTDEDMLLVYSNQEGETSKQIGWVYLVYGNDGWDVISDYTVNLEEYLTESSALADKIADGDYTITVNQ